MRGSGRVLNFFAGYKHEGAGMRGADIGSSYAFGSNGVSHCRFSGPNQDSGLVKRAERDDAEPLQRLGHVRV